MHVQESIEVYAILERMEVLTDDRKAANLHDFTILNSEVSMSLYPIHELFITAVIRCCESGSKAHELVGESVVDIAGIEKNTAKVVCEFSSDRTPTTSGEAGNGGHKWSVRHCFLQGRCE